MMIEQEGGELEYLDELIIEIKANPNMYVLDDFFKLRRIQDIINRIIFC